MQVDDAARELGVIDGITKKIVLAESETSSPARQDDAAGLACPADAPEWISCNLAVINKHELGAVYLSALEAWLSLEKKWGYDASKGTSCKGSSERPDLLDKWIRGGRAPRVRKVPVIEDVRAFEREVWTWWAGLQPPWRKIDVDGRPSEDREVDESADWGVLSVHGQNGMLNAVAVACWWGLALDGHNNRSWERFLHDITWVCEEQAE
ncbi:hypothetical protein BD626DRAFT_414131 [Schizophyllum amplum]|uniref:Uncharacterized protein n=1 Tax=Schizophyllum amplum TaxID=97359 RepID=A0A550BUX1_9AGAR|nr:hypothetical protein BD626DRAFT_414131 [Auriculariopsis ampla]